MLNKGTKIMKKFTFSTYFMISIACIITCCSFSSPSISIDQTTDGSSIIRYLTSYFVSQKTIDQQIPPAAQAVKKVIIFDLDGVLCTTNTIAALQEIGIGTIATYMLEHFQLPPKSLLFNTLADAPAITTQDAFNDGIRLPQCMVDWQINAQDLTIIQKNMLNHIAVSHLTQSEKDFVSSTVRMMTTPAQFIASRKTIPQAVTLAQALKDKGYKLYILSNWDAQSFPLFVQNFPDLFVYKGHNLFDGIMISGHEHNLKPHTQLYNSCLTKFAIDPAQAIFIDDTIENIQTAKAIGIATIHCTDKNITDVTQKLISIVSQS